MKLKIAYIIFLSILSPLLAKSDGIYPYSIKQTSTLPGGEVFVNPANADDAYFIKSGILGEDAVVYEYNVQSSKYSDGVQIDDSRIIAGHINESFLFLLTMKSDSLFLDLFKESKQITKIYITSSPEATYRNVSFQSYDGIVLLKIGGFLYLFEFAENDINKIQLLSEECISFTIFDNEKEKFIAFIEDNHENCSLTFMDSKGISLHKQIVPFSESIYFAKSNNSLVLLFSSNTNDNSLIYIIDTKTYLVENSFWIDAPAPLAGFSHGKSIYYIKYNDGGYSLIKRNLSGGTSKEQTLNSALPKEFVEPLYFKLFDDCILIIFKNAIATYSFDLKIRSIKYFPIGKWFSEINSAKKIGKDLIITSSHYTITFEEIPTDLWEIKAFLQDFWKYLIPIILIIIIIILVNIHRHQKRLLTTLLDLPATGFLFIIDKSSRLVKLNESAAALLALGNNVPLRRQFRYYFKLEHLNPILELYEQNLLTKQTFSQKLSINDGDEKEWLCYIIPIRNIAGANRGVILTGMDITEQLERKRLTNWAQLAHDMQTNLSTIRLNAEHLESDLNENNKSRQKKIMHQVNVLMQRIRDVITVGRSDTLDISLVNSSEICADVRSEFDEVVFPNVQFKLEVNNFAFKCDRQKLIRALRNAVENGIRALPNRAGVIIISCHRDGKNFHFAIKDTGIGMNEETRKKFLTPYFTTGSASGGSGIGTMIMMRVAELHGGKLIINSNEGKGTEIVFVIPNIV